MVLQHLEIEELQQYSFVHLLSTSYLLFSVICPTLSHWTLGAPRFSFSNISSSKWFSRTCFMYPSNVSFLSFESTMIYCTLPLGKFSWISTTFSLFFIYASITLWVFFTLNNIYFMPSRKGSDTEVPWWLLELFYKYTELLLRIELFFPRFSSLSSSDGLSSC